MANFLQTLTQFLKDSVGDPDVEPKLPTVLRNAGAQIESLLQFSSGLDGSGIQQWIEQFKNLITSDIIRDALAVRALQMRFPRLAEALTFLGIITFEFEPNNAGVKTLKLDWARLNKFISDPGGYAKDSSTNGALGLLLSKIQKLDDVKAMQAFIALAIGSPKELLKLDYKQEGLTALPLTGPAGVNLQDLLDLINSPLQVPLPFTPPITLSDFLALAKPPGMRTGPMGSLALLGPDGNGGDPANSLNGLGLELKLADLAAAASKTFDLGNHWSLRFAASGAAGSSTFRLKLNGNALDPAANAGATGEFSVLLGKRPPAGEPAILIGESNGTHLSIKIAEFGLRLRAGTTGPLFDVVTGLRKIEFALKPDFLKFFKFAGDIPTSLKFESDVLMNFVQGLGISGQGGQNGLPPLGVQFASPLNLKIGSDSVGLSVEQILVRLEAKLNGNDFHFRSLMRYGASAKLGPLSAVMDGAGAWLGRWEGGIGGLLPPTGIGLSLNADPVVGGGFLKIISESEFAGALQLKILGIGAFAYGLYKTLPSGDPSFIILIGIRLPLPGIQLGFGFAVSGFGGLVGINRRANTDLLRERLSSGTAGDVLFNDNPMQNAPRLLGDMQQFFPDEKGVFLIGPTLQINWLQLLKLDVGVFIELPGPRKIFIAGSARLIIGSEDFALVYLRMDFIGGIDFTRSLIFFDAALVNSHVMGIFRLTGGIALRIGYGDNGYFLFSVGGFHPSFNPSALELPKLARAGTSVSLAVVWLKQLFYLAITSNSFQIGSSTEAGLEIGPISAHGWIRFDALIQFKPFHFEARIDAGFEVEVAGVSLCGVRVEGILSGPGPLIIAARASVRILFVKISADVTLRLSDNPPDQPVPIGDLLTSLSGELIKPENLRGEGDDHSVVLAAAESDSVKRVAPIGELIWEQKRVPLNLAVEKLEGTPLGGWHTLRVKSNLPAVDEKDWFSVGTYLKLNDSAALNTARFEQQTSGLRVGAGVFDEGASVDAKLEIDLIKIPRPLNWLKLTKILSVQYLNDGLMSLMRERAGGAQPQSGGAQVKVTQENWNAHAASGVTQATHLNSVQAFVQAQRSGGIAVPAMDQAINMAGVI
jgi:hypothetical protein